MRLCQWMLQQKVEKKWDAIAFVGESVTCFRDLHVVIVFISNQAASKTVLREMKVIA